MEFSYIYSTCISEIMFLIGLICTLLKIISFLATAIRVVERSRILSHFQKVKTFGKIASSV